MQGRCAVVRHVQGALAAHHEWCLSRLGVEAIDRAYVIHYLRCFSEPLIAYPRCSEMAVQGAFIFLGAALRSQKLDRDFESRPKREHPLLWIA